MSLPRAGVLLLLWATMTGCRPAVVVPATPEGLACERECMVVYNTCTTSQSGNQWGWVVCEGQRRDCRLTCPGAHEDGEQRSHAKHENRVENYTPPDDEPEDAARQCVANYEGIAGMPEIWAQWFGGELAIEPPSLRSFADACASVPAPARRCLYSPYAARHRDECINAIRQLPFDARHAIDQLFVTR